LKKKIKKKVKKSVDRIGKKSIINLLNYPIWKQLETVERRDKEVRERKEKALIKKGTKKFIRPPRLKEKLIKELKEETQF